MTLIERLEAALGDAHDPVKVALVAGDVRALIAAHKALREAAGALLDTLEEEGAEPCDICGCGTVATHYLGWEGDGEVLCEEHAEEERHHPCNSEPLEDRELPITAPLRALCVALKGKP